MGHGQGAPDQNGREAGTGRLLPGDDGLGETRSELAGRLEKRKGALIEEWSARVRDTGLFHGASDDDLLRHGAALANVYLDTLRESSYEPVRSYVERDMPSPRAPADVISSALVFREVMGRAILHDYYSDFDRLARALDAYRPVANFIAIAVSSAVIEGRERTIRAQQEAILELSTPVLRVRDRLLILPIIGMIDDARARQLTRQLLNAIRDHRAKVAVIDITGVPVMDASVAGYLVHAVGASQLLGASLIVSGVSAGIAMQLVNIGVDLQELRTVGDLQQGIEEAERVLGLRVVAGGPSGRHPGRTQADESGG
jgi:rsbT co-antagonist protein RsbR